MDNGFGMSKIGISRRRERYLLTITAAILCIFLFTPVLWAEPLAGKVHPTVTITGPGSGEAGREIAFSARASEDVVEYQWTFGEEDTFSSFLSGKTVRHTYRSEGCYLVVCIVRDRAGRVGYATKHINIIGGAPVAPPGKRAVSEKLALVVLLELRSSGWHWLEKTLMNRLKRKYKKIYWLVGKRATRRNFFESIRHAARNGKIVDVWISVHGGPCGIALHDGSVCNETIYEQLFSRGGRSIRLVYQSNCYGACLNDDWLQVGANAVTGHVERNFIWGVHIPEFVKRWVRGVDACTATHEAYEKAKPRKKWSYKVLYDLYTRDEMRAEPSTELVNFPPQWLKESRVEFSGERVTIYSLTDEPRAEIQAERAVCTRDEPPVFRIETGSNRYYRVEMEPASFKDPHWRRKMILHPLWRGELMPSTGGKAIFQIPPDEWSKLYDAWVAKNLKKVYYRVVTFASPDDKEPRASTYKANVYSVPFIQLAGYDDSEDPAERTGSRKGISDLLDREKKKLEE
jgi:hypothetical protein